MENEKNVENVELSDVSFDVYESFDYVDAERLTVFRD